MKYFLYIFLVCIFPLNCLGQNSDSTEFDRLVEAINGHKKISTKPTTVTTKATTTPFETTKMSTEHSTSHSNSSPSPKTSIVTSTKASSASSSTTSSSRPSSNTTISSSSPTSPFPSSSPSPCPCPPAEEKTSHGWMIVGIIFIILAILEAIPLVWFGLRSFRSQMYGHDNDGLLNS